MILYKKLKKKKIFKRVFKYFIYYLDMVLVSLKFYLKNHFETLNYKDHT